MNHIMVDLETLGVQQDSIFISLGACRFNPNTGEIGEKFYERIDWDSSLAVERTVDASTLKWWLVQSAPARQEIIKAGKPLKEVLQRFGKWALTQESFLWSNGVGFDISMLENAYRKIFGQLPWEYWNARDVRTIRDLTGDKIDINRFNKNRRTVHNALDDAVYQATYVSAMWQLLKKK